MRCTQATRDFLDRMPLREGASEAFQALTYKGVPTYVFSHGFGDIVAQALIQGAGFEGGVLPQNLRIISNFFRTDPVGTVRAFSQPLVHARNRNVTTAAAHMGMPVPERPYAIVVSEPLYCIASVCVCVCVCVFVIA